MASRRGVLVPAVLLIPEEAGFSKDLEVVGDRRLVLLTPCCFAVQPPYACGRGEVNDGGKDSQA